MIEDTKKRKRGFISEEDIAIVLQRYPATTVLALLQELSQVADEKFDWNEVVKKTSTGISNPREYQMLWRRLAYNTSLVERLDEEPLDDDSDLDYEFEAIPNVTPEASAEAVACVKVLAASGMPSHSTLPNGSTVEAPSTVKIPNGQSARDSSEILQPSSFVHGRTNITVPVSVQKQPLPAVTSAEGLDTYGLASGNLPPRRKRKPWSAAEDMELIAAVKRCGEGNWANILKGDFKSERSASQLSQRWNIIRKRKGNSSLGRSLQLSEAQLAARRAVSLALNMPMADKLKPSFSPGATSLAITRSDYIHRAAEASAGIKSEPLSEYDSLPTVTQRSDISCPDSVPTIAQRSGTLGPTAKQDFGTTAAQQSIVVGVSSKPRINLKAHSTKPSPGPDGELVKAAAVAAGARIATASDAASLLRAAQAKNAVRIMSGGASMIKASVVAGSGNSLPSNVHYIRTGLATTFSTYSTAPPNVTRSTSSQHIQGHSIKQAIVQGIQKQTSPKLNAASETTKAATSGLGKVETNILEDMIPRSVDALEEFNQDDEDSDKGSRMRERGHSHFLEIPRQAQRLEGDGVPEAQIKKDQDSISSDPLLELTTEDLAKPVPVSHQCDTATLRSPSSAEVTGNGDCVVSNHIMGLCDKDKYVDMDICDDRNVGKKTDESVPMDTC